jgi:hypothetical protein
MLFPTLGTWLYFDVFAGQPGMKPAYLVSKAVQFLFPVLYAWRVQRQAVRLTLPRRSGLLAGTMFGLVVGGGLLAGYFSWLRESRYLAGADAALAAKLGEIGADTPARYVLLAVFYSVPHAFLEEYYWRWFVFGQLRGWLAWPWAAGLAGVAFALHHVIVIAAYIPAEHFATATLFFSLCVAVGGGVWAWLYERSGQLYSPWLSHLLIDAAIMAVGFDLCWRNSNA